MATQSESHEPHEPHEPQAPSSSLLPPVSTQSTDKNSSSTPPHPNSVRPLVRYVDEEQAVIDLRVSPPSTPSLIGKTDPTLEAEFELFDRDGVTYREHLRLIPKQIDKDNPTESVFAPIRFTLPRPERWWPAGMGEQPLYRLEFSLIRNDEIIDKRQATLGFTSVRPPLAFDPARDTDTNAATNAATSFLVNGQECAVSSFVAFAPEHAAEIVPVGAGSVVVIHDHFGNNALYEAADRAGILLIQSVPNTHTDGPATHAVLETELDRLAAHPSLAGYYIREATPTADLVSKRVHRLDPTRRIFRSLPQAS